MKPQFTPDFQKAGGLITAVTVDADDGEVLMVAYMNEEAFRLTLETGKVHYFSRSRNKLWKKGESQREHAGAGRDARGLRPRRGGRSRAAERARPATRGTRAASSAPCQDGRRRSRPVSERLMTPEQMYGGKS